MSRVKGEGLFWGGSNEAIFSLLIFRLVVSTRAARGLDYRLPATRALDATPFWQPPAKHSMMFRFGAGGSLSESVRCYSPGQAGPYGGILSKKGRSLKGNKICLAPSVLGRLQMRFRDRMPSPLLYRIRNPKYNKVSHCGLIEFTAPERCALLSDSFMEDMILGPGDIAELRLVDLPTLTKVIFQPFRWQFSRIQDPKGTLTRELQSHYACLTRGDTVTVTDSKTGRSHRISCVGVEPESKDGNFGGSILNTDLTVEFKEPVEKPPKQAVIRINARPTRGSVARQKYKYFRAKIVDPHRGLQILLRASEPRGAVKAFVSGSDQFPTQKTYTWYMGIGPDESGAEEIIIRPTDEHFSKTWYYIAVYGVSSAGFSLEAREVDENGNTTEGSGGGALWGATTGRGGRRASSRSRSRSTSRSPSPRFGRGYRLGGARAAASVARSKPSGRLASDELRQRRLAALSRFTRLSLAPSRAKSPATSPAISSNGDAKQAALTTIQNDSGKARFADRRDSLSIPGLIRQSSADRRRAREERIRAQTSEEDVGGAAKLGKLMFTELMRRTSTDSERSD